MPRITVIENGEPRVVSARADLTLLAASLKSGVPHYHDCGGHARCTTCRVRVIEGLEHLSPRTGLEAEIARTRDWPDDIRLACQCRAIGDATIERLVRNDDQRYAGRPRDAGSIRSEERPVAVLFCDIYDFTDFSRGQLPYDVVHVMNRFYLRIGEAVLSHGGHVDKYLGDGLMAIWGHDSDDPATFCLDALRAALLMKASVGELNASLAPHFNNDLRLRVGLHFGPAILGLIGHPDRRQLTAIGDTVNVAARVEQACKEMSADLLVTEAYLEHVRDHAEIGEHFRTLLRGQAKPTALYEITGLTDPDPAFIVQMQMDKLLLMGDRLTERFYDHFLRHESIRPLFAHVSVERQRDKLLKMIAYAVRHLRRLDAIADDLAELGRRHVGYRVTPEMYDLAGGAILAALAEVLGDEFDEASRAAWAWFWVTTTTAMQRDITTTTAG